MAERERVKEKRTGCRSCHRPAQLPASTLIHQEKKQCDDSVRLQCVCPAMQAMFGGSKGSRGCGLRGPESLPTELVGFEMPRWICQQCPCMHDAASGCKSQSGMGRRASVGDKSAYAQDGLSGGEVCEVGRGGGRGFGGDGVEQGEYGARCVVWPHS